MRKVSGPKEGEIMGGFTWRLQRSSVSQPLSLSSLQSYYFHSPKHLCLLPTNIFIPSIFILFVIFSICFWSSELFIWFNFSSSFFFTYLKIKIYFLITLNLSKEKSLVKSDYCAFLVKIIINII